MTGDERFRVVIESGGRRVYSGPLSRDEAVAGLATTREFFADDIRDKGWWTDVVPESDYEARQQ